MIRVWKIDLQLIIKIKRFLFRSLLVYFSVLLLLLLLFSLAAVLCDRNKYRCKELSCRFLNSSRIAYAILKCSHLECLRNAENHCHSRERESERVKMKESGLFNLFSGCKKKVLKSTGMTAAHRKGPFNLCKHAYNMRSCIYIYFVFVCCCCHCRYRCCAVPSLFRLEINVSISMA